ncbi:MAG: helix-turn-helix transcriptional regulator [bacterium]|nr:helix-turn-helix transcriptional regulator [bacterium]
MAEEKGTGAYTDEEWERASERVQAIREQATANPVAAAAEARRYAEITNRVQTLRAIRQARGLTQQQMSAQLDISQAEVSRMERRNNLHLATLARFIRATGGKLRITAVFDGQETEISIGDILPADPDLAALT